MLPKTYDRGNQQTATLIQDALLSKKIQFEYFEECKNRGDDSEAVIQVDFAENATFTAQNQIQSAHCKERHVTVFKCVIWSCNITESLVIIIDVLVIQNMQYGLFLKSHREFY